MNDTNSNGLPPQKHRNRMILFSIVASILIVVTIVTIVTTIYRVNEPKGQPAKNTSQANDALYAALANAAQQQRIRVAMLRHTYANVADSKSQTNAGVIASTVSEIDTAKGKYRNVFANKNLGKDSYSLGRCLDGTNYIDGKPESQKPKTLVEANRLLPRIPRVTQNLQFVTCKRVGLFPATASVDLAPVRLSDGVFPVTLQPNQANAWKDKLKAADIFTVTDEGEQTFDGKTVRKYSFAPKGGWHTVNQQLYDIFYEAAEIQKIKSENNPNAQYDYSFISSNPANSGGVKGYYLVDTQAKLPVYSELQGLNTDKPTGEKSDIARLHIGVSKQKYSYPEALTLTDRSLLEIIE